MITSMARGHRLVWSERWCYEDGIPFDDTRTCVECSLPHTKNGPDPCLGWIEGMRSVCCGHGGRQPMIGLPLI